MAVISRVWKIALALVPVVGIYAQTNWNPAYRAGGFAVSAESPAHFEAVAADLKAGLILWVPAATSQTSVAWDYSTVTNDCTNITQAVFPTWVTNAGGAYQFTGTNAMRTPNVPTRIATVVTVSAWAMVTNFIGVPQFAVSSHLNDAGTRSCFGLRLSSTNTWSIITGNNSANSVQEDGQLVVSNVWQHIVFVNSNGNRRFYLNGIQRIAVSNATYGSIGTTNVEIGTTSPHTVPRFFRGYLDGVQVWTNALSSNEIFQLVWGPTNFGARRAHGL